MVSHELPTTPMLVMRQPICELLVPSPLHLLVVFVVCLLNTCSQWQGLRKSRAARITLCCETAASPQELLPVGMLSHESPAVAAAQDSKSGKRFALPPQPPHRKGLQVAPAAAA